MELRLRKSIGPRASFHLPRHSDVPPDTTITADQLQVLQDLSLAARPSLMPTPSGDPIIPDNSNVTSAELKRRFPNDPAWYLRLPKLSSPSFTPSAPSKTLRRPDCNDVAELSLDQTEEQASVSNADSAFRKPFKRKKQLHSKSHRFDTALDNATFSETISVSKRTLKGASEVDHRTRRSNRLAQLRKTQTDPDSPVESPRESFRKWRSTVSRPQTREMADAIQDICAAIDESSDNSSTTNEPKSTASSGSQTKAGTKRLKLGVPSEENKEVSESEASVDSPFVRLKPFKKARESRYSVGAIFDETSDSVASAAQSHRTTANGLSATIEDVSGIEDNPTSRNLFGKARGRTRRFSSFERIVDADDFEQSVVESPEAKRSITKSAENRNLASGSGSRSFVADESSATAIGHKPFRKVRHQQKRSSAFADAFESEDSHTLSAVELVRESSGIRDAAAVVSTRSLANDSQSLRRGQLSSSSAVTVSRISNVSLQHSEAVEAVDPDVEVDVDLTESARSTSLMERNERKSRRSSAFVAATNDNQSLREVAQDKDRRSGQSSRKRRLLEREVSPLEHDTPLRSVGRVRERMVLNEMGRMDQYNEILSMDTSSINSFSDKQNETGNNVNGLDQEAMPVNESDFVVPPAKRKSLEDQVFQRGTPIVIMPSRVEAHVEHPPSTSQVSSTYPNSKSPPKRKSRASEQLQNKGLSSRHTARSPGAEKSSKEVYEDLPSTAEKSLTSPNSKSPSKRKSRASEQSKNRRSSLRLTARSPGAEEESEEEDDVDFPPSAERDLSSSNSKSPSKRKSRASEQSQNQRQSSRQTARPASAEKFSKEVNEDSPSTTDKDLTSQSSKSPSKRKSRASEQSQNQRQSSRQTARPASAEKFSKEVNEDSPSITDKDLTSQSSKSPSKRKSRASEQSENRRSSLRLTARSPGAEEESEEEDDVDFPPSAERDLSSSNSKSPSKRKSRASEQSQNQRQSSRQTARPASAEKFSKEVNEDSPSTTDKDLTSQSSKSPSKRKSRASEQSQNQRQSSRQTARPASAEKFSKEVNEDSPSITDKDLTSQSSKSPSKRKSRASEQSENRRSSLRLTARSPGAEEESEEEDDVDFPPSAERDLSSSNSKSPSKRKSRASEQSQNQRQSSRQTARPASAEKFSKEVNEDSPSITDKDLTSQSSKSPSKRKSRASEQSENRRSSLRLTARSPGAEEESEEDDVNFPSSAERDLSSPNSKSPSKRKSRASEQSENRRQSSRQTVRSVSAEKSSEEEEVGLPSTAERTLKSSTKQKSWASKHLQNKSQSSRQMARSVCAELSDDEYDGDLPSSAERVLSPSDSNSALKSNLTSEQLQNRKQPSRQEKRSNRFRNSSSDVEKEETENVAPSSPKPPANRRTTLSNQEQKKKRQSLREMVLLSTAAETSEIEDEALSLYPSTLSSRYSKSPSKEESHKKNKSGHRTTQFDSDVSLVQDVETGIPSVTGTSSPRALKPPSKGASLLKQIMQNKVQSFRNVNPTSETSNRADQTRRTLPKETFTDGEDSRRYKSSSRGAARETDSVRAESLTQQYEERENASQDENTHDETLVSNPSQLKGDKKEHTSVTNRSKESSPAPTVPLGEAGTSTPPKKSAIPGRVRSDIRSFFVQSTPLKQHQAGDLSETLVPLNETPITPIKKLVESTGIQLSQRNSTENPSNEERDLAVAVPRPTGSRVQELVKQMMERLPRKKEDAAPVLPRPVRVMPKLKAKSPQKPVKKKFQLILPDGKVYKQPKLPKPRKFVSDKLYRFITRNIKDNKRLDTRVRAEEFVKSLCDTYDKVLRRKNTKQLVEALLEDMVRLGLVSTYAEFYYFVEKFMPCSFRMKAIPCIGRDLAPKPKKGIYEKLEFE